MGSKVRARSWGYGVAAAFMAAFAACTGDDPSVTTTAADGGGPPGADASGGGDSARVDGGGTDADLPPLAEGKFRWASPYATGSQAVAVTASGANVFLTTSFEGTVSFDGTTLTAAAGAAPAHDLAVMKLDANGKTGAAGTWLVHLTGTGFDAPAAIGSDANGDVYVAGGSSSDTVMIGSVPVVSKPALANDYAFVVKLSGADGTKKWARTFITSGSVGCNDLAVAGSHVALACTLVGDKLAYMGEGGIPSTIVGFGARNAAYLLLQADDGEATWANLLGDADGSAATSVAVYPNGDVIAAGVFNGATLGDRAGSSKPLPRRGTSFNAFVARLGAPDGKIAWVKGYGADKANGDATAQVNEVAVASGYDVVAAGFYNGAATFGGATAPPPADLDPGGDGFVLALDAQTGATKWQKAIGGDKLDEMRAVEIDRWGYVVASGVYQSSAVTIDGEPLIAPQANATNGVVAKWAPDGKLLWKKLLVPTFATGASRMNASPSSLSAHPNGDISFAGGFEGSLDPGGGTASTATRLSSFVVHVGP